MSTETNSCEGSVDRLAKRGDIHSFTVCLTKEFTSSLNSGDTLEVSGMPVSLKAIDDEYIEFDIPLDTLIDSVLSDIIVGDMVTVTKAA